MSRVAEAAGRSLLASLKVSDVARSLEGCLLSADAEGDTPVSGGYSSDLLSDVIGNAQEGDAWVTMQKHVNIVAVAQLKGIAVIVLVNGRRPDTETLERAEQEKIPIVSTGLPAFDAAGVLYSLGLRGRKRV
jgi:hypothetical protein